MTQFQNKIAIVTGGASGIGKSIVEYLASQGTQVIIADKNIEQAKKVQFSITSTGGKSEAVLVDVADEESVKNLIEGTYKKYDRIDYLFNNAGILMQGDFQDMTLKDQRRLMDINYWGVVYGCHYVYPIMKKQGFGHIINTASLAGLMPGGLITSYAASKHAVVGLTLTLRAEASLSGIKVSTLCPGLFRTGIQEAAKNVSGYTNHIQPTEMITPERCVCQIVQDVVRNKAIIISPRRYIWHWYLYRMFPSLILYILGKRIQKKKS